MSRSFRILFLAALILFLVGCGGADKETPKSVPEPQSAKLDTSQIDVSDEDAAAPETEVLAPSTEEADKKNNATEPTAGAEQEARSLEIENAVSESQKDFKLENVPAYSGNAYISVNGNQPYFSTNALTNNSYESYSDLDSLGRCGTAKACVGLDTMPTEERGSIGQIKPTGWHTVKYDSVDGKYLYNRCHLIGYQLTAENANTSNLITGTRCLNIEGMLPFENMVADYVKETGNHVEYHVTPVFEGQDLLARGVLMEGYSVEDQGDGICFCVFAYNSQPGIDIDYATGDSKLSDTAAQVFSGSSQSVPSKSEDSGNMAPSTAGTADNKSEEAPETESQKTTYVLNTNTKKFHYPSCSSVDSMKESNKKVFTGRREDVVAQGYVPCKRCYP